MQNCAACEILQTVLSATAAQNLQSDSPTQFCRWSQTCPNFMRSPMSNDLFVGICYLTNCSNLSKVLQYCSILSLPLHVSLNTSSFPAVSCSTPLQSCIETAAALIHKPICFKVRK